jgi:hypothetical protein
MPLFLKSGHLEEFFPIPPINLIWEVIPAILFGPNWNG